MRIFYAACDTPNPFFNSSLWRANLYFPLVDLGHEVVEFQYDLTEAFLNVFPQDPVQKAYIEKNRPRLSKELLAQVKNAHTTKPIDLFFSYFYDYFVLPEAIDEIRSLGIKTVNWYCNGSYQLDLVAEISPHYDWCLVPEKFRLKDYEVMGARPIYSQEAANPTIYKPYNLPIKYDATFIGQCYGDRPQYIKYFLEQGIDVRVWGFGWSAVSEDSSTPVINPHNPTGRPTLRWRSAARAIKQFLTGRGWQSGVTTPPTIKLPGDIIGGVLSDEEMIRMYSRSKINLGFSTCGNTHTSRERIVQIRLRDFEVPMSGGFYMVEYMEELEEFFKVGEEIVCYSSKEDAADKIKYYLAHDSERESIRRAGYERCLRDHTWQNRFESAFRLMGLK